MEEEKVIIESKSLWAKRKKFVVALLIISIIIPLLLGAIAFLYYNKGETLYWEHHYYEYGHGAPSSDKEWYSVMEEWSRLDHIEVQFARIAQICVVTLIPVSIIVFLIYLYASKMQITVTDKRVFGKAAFGKRVDLPLDSISAVGTSVFNGLAVASSAGSIHFLRMDNRDQVHNEISKLLVERQAKEKPVATTTITQAIQQSSVADELEKFKGLLDKGIITQEEFDAKKKQLLGL